MHTGLELCLLVAVVCAVPGRGTASVLPRFSGNDLTSGFNDVTSASDEVTTDATSSVHTTTSGLKDVTPTYVTAAAAETSTSFIITSSPAVTIVTTSSGQEAFDGTEVTTGVPQNVTGGHQDGPVHLEAEGGNDLTSGLNDVTSASVEVTTDATSSVHTTTSGLNDVTSPVSSTDVTATETEISTTSIITSSPAPNIVTTSSGQEAFDGVEVTSGVPPNVTESHHEGPEHLEAERVCGKSSLTGLHEKVINGSDTAINQYPWMVAIMGSFFGYRFVQCGGTIIDRRHILTAAHCVAVYKALPQKMIIHVGEYNISAENETNVIRPVAQEVIVHPDHDEHNFLYDAAIIRLTAPLELAENVRPICLPFNTTDTYTNSTSTVTGWGMTGLGMEPSDVLLQAQLDIIDNKECYDAYLEKYPERITGEVMCAVRDSKDSCQGDSGGPLMVLANNSDPEAWYQVGIVSWGIGCAHPKYPGVYTRVTSILDWIRVATKL